MDQMQDDDGFGDFRAKVKGLPREQRMAELKKMEDAVLENLRSNMLADLYAEDQPTPGPKQPQVGRGQFEQDTAPDRGTMTDDYPFSLQGGEDDVDEWFDRKYGQAKPEDIDRDLGELKAELDGYHADGSYGGDASMASQDIYDRLLAHKKAQGRDARTPFKPSTNPDGSQTYPGVGKTSPPRQGANPMRKPPMKMGAIIDDEEPMAFGDVASPTKFQEPQGGDPGEKYPWVKEEEAKVESIRQRRGDREPPEMENYGINPSWLEWRYEDATPEEIQKDYAREKAVLDAEEPSATDAYLMTKQMVEFLEGRMKRPRTAAPKAQGMFGRPPGGITANRMMIDE